MRVGQAVEAPPPEHPTSTAGVPFDGGLHGLHLNARSLRRRRRDPRRPVSARSVSCFARAITSGADSFGVNAASVRRKVSTNSTKLGSANVEDCNNPRAGQLARRETSPATIPKVEDRHADKNCQRSSMRFPGDPRGDGVEQ